MGVALGTTALVGTAAACTTDSTGPEGMGSVQVLLTDAPTDMLDSAHVWISRIHLVGGGGEEPDTVDADSVTADLTREVALPLDRYRDLRFVVDSARVVLAEGFTFHDGSASGVLKVPSGRQTGIKVKLRDILEPTEDGTLVITVGFDVDANFKIITQGPGGSIKKILFTPVLREESRGRGGVPKIV
ncbi:MAG: DUF4382 domain-containing protein [Gemmatimonadota bacterium]